MILGAVSALLTGSGLANTILGLFPPLSTAYTKWAYSMWPNMVPGLGDLIEMRFRDQITQGEYETAAEQQGFGYTWSRRLLEAGKRYLNAADYVALWRREKISEDDLIDRLKLLHFDDNAINEVKAATEFFPQPQDLVRFAVREVYTPETVARFGQLEDLPPKFVTEAQKAGIPPDVSPLFWAAHWDLPSPAQGFEMFQRDVIEESDLFMLLKALDIMPFWRDNLTKIAYNTLTRVDVRRMHAMGVLSDTQTYDAYRHQGFSPDDAGLMLSFTKEFNASGDKELTRGMLMDAFNLDLLNSPALITALSDLGYAFDVAVAQVSTAQYKKDLSDIEDAKKEYTAQVNSGQLSIENYKLQLDAMGLPSTYVDRAVSAAQLHTAEKVKLPSKADIEKWLQLQIIDEVEYTATMRQLHYRQSDIEKYLTEIAFTQDTSVRKFLGVETYVRWFTNNILDENGFRFILHTMKIVDADIERHIQEVEAKKNAE